MSEVHRVFITERVSRRTERSPIRAYLVAVVQGTKRCSSWSIFKVLWGQQQEHWQHQGRHQGQDYYGYYSVQQQPFSLKPHHI